MKGTATTKQTSGKGFSFEIKVCSYFAVQMLAKVSFPFRNADIIELAFQRKRYGWLLDDVVLALCSKTDQFHAALSVKSNQQFGARSAPLDFVADAWQQYLREGTDAFDPSRDLLGLVTAPLPEPPRSAVHALLAKASQLSPTDLDATMASPEKTASEVERALYDSFKCPAALASKHPSLSTPSGRMLQCLAVMDFDFDDAVSAREQEAVRWCISLLEPDSSSQGVNLWQSILATVDACRTEGGTLERPTLLRKLARQYDMAALPDFAHDWTRLRTFSEGNMSVIPDTIGGEISLPRNDARRRVEEALAGARRAVVIGPSGTGKTVVAKSYCLHQLRDHHTEAVWVDCKLISPTYFDDLPAILVLKHALADVLAHRSRANGLIVLDGLEALHGEVAFKQVARILQVLGSDDSRGAWHVLATCQDEPWQRVETQLSRIMPSHVHWKPVHVSYPSDADLKPVREQFPGLAKLLLRPHLKRIVAQPKILDILARGEKAGHHLDASGWVGESDLIEWYWTQVVRGGTDPDGRARFLMCLAQRQADDNEFFTPLSTVEPASTHLIPSLVQAGICSRRDESLGFVHDLIGDWCRQRVLLGHQARLSCFVDTRASNPRWLRAIQLLGVKFLESADGAVAWKDAIDSCPTARDAFLEALVFAVNADSALDTLWPALAADDGNLLRHFLSRFRHVATVINPQIMGFFADRDPEMLTYARTHDRIPLWPYWVPVLSFLDTHRADVLSLAPDEVSRVAYQWLRLTRPDYPQRQEAARLALERAEAVFDARLERPWRDSESDCWAYRAALHAAGDATDRVISLCLHASSRRLPERVASGAVGDYRPPGTVSHRTIVHTDCEEVEQEPWPDGPMFRVDDEFKHACLHTDALVPMMRLRPDIAREVILALLIERRPPQADHPFLSYHSHFDDNYGVEDDSEFSTRFYTKGPFLLFLRHAPDEAIETIIRLVDFATERWVGDANDIEEFGPMAVRLAWSDGERTLAGNYKVFYWYRGCAWYPAAVSSALMALEKWIYEQLDAGRSVSERLSTIMIRTTSVAFAGLLCEIGKRHKDLFREVLYPLLVVPEFYAWEQRFFLQGCDRMGTPIFSMDEDFFNLAREWDTMPHRKEQLLGAALPVAFSCEPLRPFFDQARAQWQQEAGRASSESRRLLLENLTAWFDEGNWKARKRADGSVETGFVRPNSFESRIDDDFKAMEKRMQVLNFPYICHDRLEKHKPLPTGELDDFWTRLQDYAVTEIDDEQLTGLRAKFDCVCAGICVLVIFHRDWLREHPDKEKWCITQLQEIVHTPAQTRPFDIETSVLLAGWDKFAAQVIPVLWAEDAESEIYRDLAARLATSRHYNCIAALLRSAYALRDRLGGGFERLVRLVLEWAVVYRQGQEREHSRAFDPKYPKGDAQRSATADRRFSALLLSPIGTDQKKTTQWLRRNRAEFSKNEVPPDWPDWGELALADGYTWFADDPNRRGTKDEVALARYPSFDMCLLQHAFDGLLNPSEALSDEERRRWIAFWEQAVRASVGTLTYFDRDGTPLDSDEIDARLPYDSDYWVLRQVAKITVQLESFDAPERLWKPVLSLGSRAHVWVEAFVRQFIASGLNGNSPLSFKTLWQSLIDYAFSSAAWGSPRTPRSGFYAIDCWHALMGFDSLSQYHWKAEHSTLVEEMIPYFDRWAHAFLDKSRSCHAFAQWLRCDSAGPLHAAGIRWLAEAEEDRGEEWWDDSELHGSLARLLDHCWRNSRDQVTGDSETEKAFRQLLKGLSDRQNVLAIDLQDRIATGT